MQLIIGSNFEVELYWGEMFFIQIGPYEACWVREKGWVFG